MARTRRVGSRRSQAARQEKEESAVEEIDFDDLEEVDFEDGESDVVEAPSSGSRRASRAGGRSRAGSRTGSRVGSASASGRRSRRTAAASGRSSSRRSAKRELTPEELEEKRRGRKALINLFIGLLLLAAAGFGIFWALKPNPLAATANGDLNTAQQLLLKMDNSLRDLNPDAALEAYNKANSILRTPLFANGGEEINPDDERLASVQHARDAKKLLVEFDDLYARIDRVRFRVLANNNLKMITDKLNNINKLTDDELDELGRLIEGYRENPLDPQLGETSTVHQETYAMLIARLTGKEQDVVQERKRRLDKRTTFVEKEVNSKVDKLLNQERYQAALDHIDETAKNSPDAALAPIRDRVVATAKKKWEVVKKNAEGRYADGTSATNNMESRKKSLKTAVESMEEVVEKFGIEEYVREARELKTKYERAIRNLDD